MENINLFELSSSLEAAYEDGTLAYPNTSLVKETNQLHLLFSGPLYEWVDLGLPSGVKWAAWNVGATKPEEYGLYFAWGETQGYTRITNDKQFSLLDYELCNGSNTTLTKYNNDSSYGTVDNLSSLTTSDDAAYQSDNTCRMPTKADFDELKANTTSALTSVNGVSGLQFTSKVEGYTDKSIFVPAAGYCYYGSLNDAGSYGYYWSSSLDESYSCFAWGLVFYSGDVNVFSLDRCYGQSVRAVKD